jgi:glycosyltransferase involved in cell wall biosynthesis
MTPFFSIITVVFNRAKTIEIAISSLRSQSFKNYEHIIIDGGSTDGTHEILEKYKSKNTVIVSEGDRGIYDAINKGIAIATGKYIGVLHSDDFYPNRNTLGDVFNQLARDDIDVIYGDAKYLRARDSALLRYYRSNNFSYQNLRYGIMLAHTTLYVKKTIFYDIGVYDIDYKIAGDFEFVCRLFKKNIKAIYIPKVLMMMRDGGLSNANIANRILINKELLRACDKNGIRTNYFYLGLRYLKKILQYRVIRI